jgi:hypothetical protein
LLTKSVLVGQISKNRKHVSKRLIFKISSLEENPDGLSAYLHILSEHDIIPLIKNKCSIKEVLMMQDPMSFHQFASQLPKVFEKVAKHGEKVLVEKDGMLFRLEPEETPKKPDIWANYDPEKVREGLRKSAGALKGVDIAALKRDIRDQRAQDSKDRPA